MDFAVVDVFSMLNRVFHLGFFFLDRASHQQRSQQVLEIHLYPPITHIHLNVEVLLGCTTVQLH